MNKQDRLIEISEMRAAQIELIEAAEARIYRLNFERQNLITSEED